MEPNVGEDDPILTNAKQAVDPRLAVRVMSPVKVQRHDDKSKVQFESACLVCMTFHTFILHF